MSELQDRLTWLGRCVASVAVATTLAGVALGMGSHRAEAQDYAYMSCGELWYARNAIFARRGYCFRSARARSVFGRGCFPPYGRLRGWERRQVNRIKRWERRNGC
ncbi:MAG: YARHG domain-containing protein [Pseudomonadota bacterium]